MLLKDWRQQSPPVPRAGNAQQDEAPVLNEAMDKSLVAELSSSAIDKMTCEELARVISAAELLPKMKRGGKFQLPLGDRGALLKLTYLARRCCQNQGY